MALFHLVEIILASFRAFFSVKSMEYVHDENLYNILLIVVDCGILTNPTNGQVSHTAGTKFGQTATYSCDTGYNLVGDGTRICQAGGVWSGSEPNCQGMLLLECMFQVKVHPKVHKLIIMRSDWIPIAFSGLAIGVLTSDWVMGTLAHHFCQKNLSDLHLHVVECRELKGLASVHIFTYCDSCVMSILNLHKKKNS